MNRFQTTSAPDGALVEHAGEMFLAYGGRLLPRIAGASPTTYNDAIVNPLGPPTVTGTTVTVDGLMNTPTRVTRIVADLTMTNFFLDQIFASAGSVEGGAVPYDQANYLDTYTDRDVERVEPGNEAPIVGGVRTGPLVAQVEKFMAKFPFTDEARRRNQLARYNNQLRRVANTIVRKMNQRGMAELAAAISAYSRTASGVSWSDATALTMTTRAPSLMPMADIVAAKAALELLEMGYEYDTLVVHPTEAESLRMIYDTDLSGVLSDNGISTLIVTPRQTAGQAYLLAGGEVGELRIEEPLRTTVEREGAPQLREQTWTQSAVNPVVYVTDPYAILQITGLEA